MARAPRLSPEERRAQRLQELCGDQYEELNVDGCREEIARLTKQNMDYSESKKDAAATWKSLMDDTKDKIEFLVERIDHLHHEAQVQAQLERAR